MFKAYVLFLILSGIAMLVITGIRSGQTKVRRVWTGVVGAGFLGYGLYLLLIFRGGHYFLFFYVFILPILLIAQFFRDRGAFRARQQAATFGPPRGYFQPGGYGQPPPPGYGQPPAYGQRPPPDYAQPAGYGSHVDTAGSPDTATESSAEGPNGTAWEWTATGGWQPGHAQPSEHGQPPPPAYGQPSGEQPQDPAV